MVYSITIRNICRLPGIAIFLQLLVQLYEDAAPHSSRASGAATGRLPKRHNLSRQRVPEEGPRVPRQRIDKPNRLSVCPVPKGRLRPRPPVPSWSEDK